jgi:hypothetical protein
MPLVGVVIDAVGASGSSLVPRQGRPRRSPQKPGVAWRFEAGALLLSGYFLPSRVANFATLVPNVGTLEVGAMAD